MVDFRSRFNWIYARGPIFGLCGGTVRPCWATTRVNISETKMVPSAGRRLTIAAAAVVAGVQVGDDGTVKQAKEAFVLLRAELGVGRVRVTARTLAVGALSVQLLSRVANLGAGLGEGQSGGGEEGGDGEELHCDGWFVESVGLT